MSRGWIYCLSNKYMPGILKIGQTKGEPLLRADQLYTTGVPVPFKVELSVLTDNYEKKERIIHSLLEKNHSRVNPKREFFEISVEEVKPYFDLMMDSKPEKEKKTNIDLCLVNGQRVRHTVGDDTIIGIYNKQKNVVSYNGVDYEIPEFQKNHYLRMKMDPKSPYDETRFEFEIDGKWMSIKN
jgi:hypothetical protein